MTDSPALPAAAPATASPTTVRAAAFGALAGGIIACVAGYLALAAPGSWIGGARELQWTARELSVTRGAGQLTRDGLLLTASDPAGTVIVSLPTSFRSHDYPVIAWGAAGIPEGVEAALLWHNDYQPSRVFTRSLTVEAGGIAPATVARERNWIGRIGGLALALRGSFTEPILVRGVAAKPMTPAQVLGDRVSEWLAFEPWNGASITTLTGGADAQDLPLPVLLAAVAGMAALIYAGLVRWRPGLLGPSLGVVIAAFFVGAWFILDARWQWNLSRQVGVTHAQYAGKSWQERHLAAEDGPLFAFIEKVRAKLPAPPVRMFMVADAHYFRDRGAYHLYPYNVYFDPWRNTMPPPSALRPGDYIVVYQRKGVQYDAAQQRLRWDGLAPVEAELVLADAGSALFRIR
jgi:hypothetical protein